MTIRYECEVPMRNVSKNDRKALTGKLDSERYEWYYENSTLIICGEVEIDDYDCSADDVANEIEWIVDATTGLSVTAVAKEVEHEPDWDRMPGGVDYGFWN